MVKVLIVDDEESILSLLTAIFCTMPEYTVLQAHDGPEAILTAQKEKPDIMLVDNRMPGMCGIDVCRSIKANPELTKTRILILSCQGQNFDWNTALESGASGYLCKPFETGTLMEKVRELSKS